MSNKFNKKYLLRKGIQKMFLESPKDGIFGHPVLR